MKRICTYRQVLGKVTRYAILPLLAINISLTALASNHSYSHSHKAKVSKLSFRNMLKKTLSTSAKKREFAYISAKLAQSNMPRFLALIPVIETNYKQNAV